MSYLIRTPIWHLPIGELIRGDDGFLYVRFMAKGKNGKIIYEIVSLEKVNAMFHNMAAVMKSEDDAFRPGS